MVDVERLPGAEIAARKQLLAEGLFQLIGERIVSGELAPGARIRDGELAHELSVSRTPVREALQRLERIGLVTMYPSRYTEVSSVAPDQVEAAREFTALQAGINARLACPRLSPQEVTTVCGLVRAVPADLTDAAATARARRALIGYLASRSGNPLQQALVDEASLALARAMKTYVVPAHEHSSVISACADLEDAFQRGDADAAERACRRMYCIT